VDHAKAKTPHPFGCEALCGFKSSRASGGAFRLLTFTQAGEAESAKTGDEQRQRRRKRDARNRDRTRVAGGLRIRICERHASAVHLNEVEPDTQRVRSERNRLIAEAIGRGRARRSYEARRTAGDICARKNRQRQPRYHVVINGDRVRDGIVRARRRLQFKRKLISKSR